MHYACTPTVLATCNPVGHTRALGVLLSPSALNEHRRRIAWGSEDIEDTDAWLP
jgi:hypothetical protein